MSIKSGITIPLGSGGGGSEDLDQVLHNGNTSALSIDLTNGLGSATTLADNFVDLENAGGDESAFLADSWTMMGLSGAIVQASTSNLFGGEAAFKVDTGATSLLELSAETNQDTCFFSYVNNGQSMTFKYALGVPLTGSSIINYRSFAGTSQEVAYLSDVPGTPTLSSVLAAGNTANNSMELTDGINSTNYFDSQVLLLLSSGAAATLESAGGITTISAINNVGTSLAVEVDDVTNTGSFLYVNSGHFVLIKFNGGVPLGGDSTLSIKQGTNEVFAFVSDLPLRGNFANATFTGTAISITTTGFTGTPVFGSIVAKNAASAIALAPGYRVAYGAGNLTVTLVTNVAVAISLNIDWMILKQ